MAENLSMALAELLRKADAEPDLDTLREGVRVMTQALMARVSPLANCLYPTEDESVS